MILIFLILISLGIALIGFASMNLCFGVFLKSQCRSTNRTDVWLTFDDGPHPIYTPLILDVLKEHQVKAYFFVIGHLAEQHPEIVKRMVDEGHEVGCHSYSHQVNFGFSSTNKVLSDIKKGIEAIEQAGGKKVQWFRPPFGVSNPNIGKAVRRLNLKVMAWNVRSFDTHYPSDKVLDRVCKRTTAGSIILLHDRLEQTPQNTALIIQCLSKKGLSTKTRFII